MIQQRKNKISDMPKSARTHDEARAVVCCCCGRKVTDGKGCSTKMAELVRQFAHKNFSVENLFHPTALCSTCRVSLSAFEKVRQNIIHTLAESINISGSSPDQAQVATTAELSEPWPTSTQAKGSC